MSDTPFRDSKEGRQACSYQNPATRFESICRIPLADEIGTEENIYQNSRSGKKFTFILSNRMPFRPITTFGITIYFYTASASASDRNNFYSFISSYITDRLYLCSDPGANL